MREFRPYGSVRGALSDERPYRDLFNRAVIVPLGTSGPALLPARLVCVSAVA
jgi:hypothetical protein